MDMQYQPPTIDDIEFLSEDLDEVEKKPVEMPSKRVNWKLISGAIIGAIIILTVILLIVSSKNKSAEKQVRIDPRPRMSSPKPPPPKTPPNPPTPIYVPRKTKVEEIDVAEFDISAPEIQQKSQKSKTGPCSATSALKPDKAPRKLTKHTSTVEMPSDIMEDISKSIASEHSRASGNSAVFEEPQDDNVDERTEISLNDFDFDIAPETTSVDPDIPNL